MDDDGLMMTMMLMMEMTMTATMKEMMTTTMTLRVRKSIGRPSVIQAGMKNNLEARPHWLQCPRGKVNMIRTVLDPGKGVCADPVGRDATLGVGGPGPPVGAGERQLNLDRGGEKT